MLADDHRVDVHRPNSKPLGQVDAEAEAVEQRPRGEDAVVPSQLPGQVSERIGRVGDDQQDRTGGGCDDLGDELSINRGVRLEQRQASVGVGIVG